MASVAIIYKKTMAKHSRTIAHRANVICCIYTRLDIKNYLILSYLKHHTKHQCSETIHVLFGIKHAHMDMIYFDYISSVWKSLVEQASTFPVSWWWVRGLTIARNIIGYLRWKLEWNLMERVLPLLYFHLMHRMTLTLLYFTFKYFYIQDISEMILFVIRCNISSRN